MTMTTAILWPTFALVALIYTVWLTMFVQRVRHMRANPPTRDSFASGSAAQRYFEPVEMPANNFANLFEMPVLFFALVPLLLLTHHAGHVEVALVWIFVAARAVHSIIHVAKLGVQPRFMAYLVSCAVLSAMWIGFAVDMATGR